MTKHVAARRQLESMRDDLIRALRTPFAVELEACADPIDGLLASIERDAGLAHLQRTAGLYREVMAALSRICKGEYGMCEDCGERISQRRLKAVPYARRCVGCQDRIERTAA